MGETFKNENTEHPWSEANDKQENVLESVRSVINSENYLQHRVSEQIN